MSSLGLAPNGVGVRLGIGVGPGAEVGGGAGVVLPMPGLDAGELVTVTTMDARTGPVRAVTWVVPGALPVTLPEELTVATAGFPVFQMVVASSDSGAFLPLDSMPLSVSRTVCPGVMRMVRGVIFSERSSTVAGLVARRAANASKSFTHRASRALVAPAGAT